MLLSSVNKTGESPRNKQRTALLLVLITMLFTLCSCAGNKEAEYEAYVRSIISANYLGDFSKYTELTGINTEDAKAAYDRNISRLTANICRFYELDISENAELLEKVNELSKLIYSKIKYEVSPLRKEGDSCYVDLSISPINLFVTTEDKMKAYVKDYDARIKAGEFNDVAKEEYVKIFSSGLIDVLTEAAQSMPYLEPVTVNVRILTSGDSYSIRSEDLVTIDSLLISTRD